jgi:hypothetical protein
MLALVKPNFLLVLFLVSLVTLSCGNSTEEKYIELLEERLSETSFGTEELIIEDLTTEQVNNQIIELVSFLCPSSSKSLLVRSKRLSSKKWLVNISFEMPQLDEYGFPFVHSESEILRVLDGELEFDPILKLEFPCE